MRVGLEHTSISRLELPLFLGLRLVRIDREIFVHEKVPDLDSLFSGVERFVLGIADATEIRIRGSRFCAVALTDELHHALALVDLVPQHLPQITCLGPENVLPDRFVAQEGQRVGNELAGAAQFLAHSGDEDGRARRHDDLNTRSSYDVTSTQLPDAAGLTILRGDFSRAW